MTLFFKDRPEACEQDKARRSRLVWCLPAVLLIGFLLIVTLQVPALSVAGIEALREVQVRLRPWLQLGRITIWIAVIASWPRLVPWLADRLGLPAALRTELLDYRWRLALWMLLLEAVVGQNLPGKMLDLLAGKGT